MFKGTAIRVPRVRVAGLIKVFTLEGAQTVKFSPRKMSKNYSEVQKKKYTIKPKPRVEATSTATEVTVSSSEDEDRRNLKIASVREKLTAIALQADKDAARRKSAINEDRRLTMEDAKQSGAEKKKEEEAEKTRREAIFDAEQSRLERLERAKLNFSVNHVADLEAVAGAAASSVAGDTASEATPAAIVGQQKRPRQEDKSPPVVTKKQAQVTEGAGYSTPINTGGRSPRTITQMDLEQVIYNCEKDFDTESEEEMERELFYSPAETLNKVQAALENVPGGLDLMKELKLMISRLAKGQIQEIKTQAVKVFRSEKEIEVCNRSIMAFNVDKWQLDSSYYGNLPLEEKLTEEIHCMTKARVTVLEVVPIRNSAGPPTAAKIVFGSQRQKGTFYRALAEISRSGNDSARRVGFRDAFPQDKLDDARALVQRGTVLKRNKKVHSFRVVAQGAGCIPVLQVRDNAGERWKVFQSQMTATGAATGDEAGGSQRSVVGNNKNEQSGWQTVGARKRAVQKDSKLTGRQDAVAAAAAISPKNRAARDKDGNMEWATPGQAAILHDDAVVTAERALAKAKRAQADFMMKQAERDNQDELHYEEDF